MVTGDRGFKLKAIQILEDIDQDAANAVMSDPDLDSREISDLIEDSIMGNYFDKKENKVLKLNSETIQKGLLNLLDRAIKRIEIEENEKNENII